MTVRIVLDEDQFDYLREMMNVAAGHSAGMLSLLLRRPVSSQIPVVRICAPHELHAIVDPPSQPSIGVNFNLPGNIPNSISGQFFFIVKDRDKNEIVRLITARVPENSVLDDAGIITLIARIVVTSHFDAINRFCGLEFDEGEPTTVSNMLKTLIDEAVASAAQDVDVLAIRNDFLVGENRMRTFLLMLPDAKSVPTLVNSIEEARRRIFGNSR